MLYRSPLVVMLCVAVLAAACDEFPEPLPNDSGEVPITIDPVDWPAELAIGSSRVLEVEVVDGQGNVVMDVVPSWAVAEGSAGVLQPAGGELERQLSGDTLGWAVVTVSVDESPFVPTTLRDSVAVLLAGVGVETPSGDTTLTAVGDTLALSAGGFDAEDRALVIAEDGLEWAVFGDSVVTAAADSAGRTFAVEAAAEGTALVVARHAQCVSGGPCADTLAVTVDQTADSVALASRSDTLVAEDTVRLAVTVFDANGFDAPNETVTWTSRDAGVAEVDADGDVVAVSEGQTWVVAGAGTDAADSASIEVAASGVMTVDLTDAPADLLASAELFLAGVYVIDNITGAGRRYVLDEPFSADLLTLADTVAALGDVRLPAGTYPSVFLAVDSARITLRDAYTFDDATRVRTFTVPGDTIAAAIEGNAEFAGGDTIAAVLDFDVDGSFPMPEPTDGVVGSVSFEPTTRVLDRAAAASIGGALTNTGTADVEAVAVRAVRTDVVGDTAFSRTDAGGVYAFRYVAAGSYDLSVPRAPDCHVANPAELAVTVAAGEASGGADFTIDPVAIDSIVIGPAEDTINALGFTTALAATAYEGDSPLSGLGVEWASADPTLAEVNGAGTVTGIAVGTARIAATACGATDTALVTVRQLPGSVAVEPALAEIEAGATQQFSATLFDSGGAAIDTATFEWSSLNTDVATIDASGLATAHQSGIATIEALHAASGITGSTDLSVLLASAEWFSLNDHFGCALTATNQVVCWGANPHGELGFPAEDFQTPFPPQTIGLPTSETYTQVVVGGNHGCALTSAGDIYCWGQGGSGELGNGSNFDNHDPVLVDRPAGETFTDVATGHRYTCAATASGQAYCWGFGGNGRLGNGTTDNRNVPEPVNQSGLEFVDVDAERGTTCALTSGGDAYCWGRGDQGELGNGSTSDSFVPAAVSMPGTTFNQLALSGNRGCALGDDGGAYCWGRNAANGLHDDNTVPERVGTETFVAFGNGGAAACGARSDGSVLCAGNNYYAQFGNGGTASDFNVVWEAGATGVSAVMLDGSGDTMCGLDAGGDVYCWGAKHQGSTGTGQGADTWDPVQPSVAGVIDLTYGNPTVCALTDLNEVYCWGFIGRLNGYDPDNSAVPTLVTQPPAGVVFSDLEMGGVHTCALSDGGELYCIGENYTGQLGNGTFNGSTQAWVRVPHPEDATWQDVATGNEFTCALDAGSDIYCWGYNGNGQLGTGTGVGESFETPQLTFDAGVNYTNLSAGGYHVCAATTGSSVYCWGWGGYGQLGNGGTSDQTVPTEIQTGGEFFRTVAASNETACALTFDDAAYCWGRNWAGQLGDGGSYDFTSSPVAVVGGLAFERVYTSQSMSCGVDAAGATSCWGANFNGQFGNGEAGTSEHSPVGAYTGNALEQVQPSNSTSCALDTGGNVWCAGSHNHGDTGVGLRLYELLPVRVGSSGG